MAVDHYNLLEKDQASLAKLLSVIQMCAGRPAGPLYLILHKNFLTYKPIYWNVTKHDCIVHTLFYSVLDNLSQVYIIKDDILI